MGKETLNKINKPRAIRRLVIWYKRNSAVTSIVDTAANSAVTASNVAGNVVSGAGSVVSSASNVAGNVAGNVVSSAESVVNTASSVVSNASSLARNTLQPLVFDPLKRLQNSDNALEKEYESNAERIWIAVDGMGGDYAPAPILEGCLDAISRFPINVKFVGNIEKVRNERRIAAPVNSMIEASNDPDIIANNYVTDVYYPEINKTLKVHGTPWKFSETPAIIGKAPKLGADNHGILKEIGYTEEDIKKFEQKEII